MSEIKLKEFLVQYTTPLAENSPNGSAVVNAVNWRMAVKTFEDNHPMREVRRVWESRAIGKTVTTRRTTVSAV